MNAHHNLAAIAFFLFGAWIAVSIIYNVVKYGGLAAAGFRAPVERTVGQCTLDNGTTLKVHRLGGGSPERAIGVEFVQHGLPVLVVALSVSEAQKFAALVELAAGGNGAQRA